MLVGIFTRRAFVLETWTPNSLSSIGPTLLIPGLFRIENFFPGSLDFRDSAAKQRPWSPERRKVYRYRFNSCCTMFRMDM